MISFVPEPYQALAEEHLLKNDSAALFMGCGMGKTATSLSAANQLFQDAAIRGILVVAPLRVANLTWAAEVSQFREFSWMTVMNLRTKEGMAALERGEAHIYTINYESLPRVCEKIHKMFLRRSLPFDTVIFDELTMAKNPKSKRIRAYVNFLRSKVSRHWGLTGTPITNNLLDLHAQIRLLDGGERLGKSYNAFRDCYFYPADYMRYSWKPFPHLKGKIEEKISDMALSLRREDYLDIPDLIFEDIQVPLNPETMKVYKELKKHYFVEVDGKEIVADSAGVLVQKLLQVVSGAVYYDEDKNTVDLDTNKLIALKKLVKKLKEPILLGCNFKHEQDRIRKHFPEAVFAADYSGEKKEKQLEDMWNEGKIQLLVAHPKTLGHGLNMQRGGRYVVWYTQPWSRELFDQMNFRLSRKGQGNEVTVFRLICQGTVDDAIAEALRGKLERQEMFLEIIENLKKMDKLF